MVFLTNIAKCCAIPKVGEKITRSKFIDTLRLHVKGGPGGMGYPKYGGVGGAGGSVYVVGDEGETLKGVFQKNKTKRVTAPPGENSHKKCILGNKGADVTIKAPIGITLFDETGKKLGEINKEGDTVLIAHGGLGGCPDTGHSGLKGQAHVVTFDLKLIADVGLVGFPNAGKSTLLSALSKARPKIASYPFTTIRPNIGTINYPDLRQISIADLPGLIEGAHVNFGMGHKFLKHIERTKLLVLVVDVGGFRLSPKHSSRSALETIVLLNKELELYREDLVDRPAMLVVNKMDKPGSDDIFSQIKDAVKDWRGVLEEVPPEIRPNKPLEFERVVCMTAKDKIETEVEEMKENLRDVLDSLVLQETLENETVLLESLNRQILEQGPRVV